MDHMDDINAATWTRSALVSLNVLISNPYLHTQDLNPPASVHRNARSDTLGGGSEHMCPILTLLQPRRPRNPVRDEVQYLVHGALQS